MSHETGTGRESGKEQESPEQTPDQPQAKASGLTYESKRKTSMKEANSPGAGGTTAKVPEELKRLVAALQAGKLDKRVDAGGFSGDWADVFEGLNGFADTLQGLSAGMNTMSAAHDAGDIDVMIDAADYPGEFGRMASGINKMVGGHIAVKKKAMACVAEFANGNFEAQLEKFPGKKAFINDTIETLRKNLQQVVAEIAVLTQASQAGLLDERGRSNQFKGDFAGMVGGINNMLDAILLPIAEGNRVLRLIRGGNLREKVEIECHGDHQRMKEAVNGVQQWLTDLIAFVNGVANGNLTVHVDKASDQDQVHEWLMLLKANIAALVADANMLAKAAVEGKLATRADAGKHQGDYRRIVEGVNNTLDSVIGPLNVAANYVDQISKGAIPAKISDSYNGDFNVLKNNLNTCIDAVNALVADANRLSVAAVEGKLATRADASKHQGDFRKIVQGVNETLDAVIGPLNVAANYVDRISKGAIPAKISDSYNGDFNVLKNNLNTCIDAVNALVADAGMLAKAAVEGKLATRADASKHQGDFRKIVQGVNETLDAVIGPLNVAANYVDQISKGDDPGPDHR